MDRRSFLWGLSTAACVPGSADGVVSDPSCLRVGVLSDIHVSVPECVKTDSYAKACLGTGAVFERALRYFRKRGVDAVVIAGDLTEFGLVSELDEVARIWRKVFPGDIGEDGVKVAKVFVLGNHDSIAWGWKSTHTGELWKGAEKEAKWNASIAKDPAAAWKRCFGEEYAPLQIKNVRGYDFVMAHWLPADPGAGNWGQGADIPEAVGFMRENAGRLRGEKPFFYVQHAHPKNTCLPFAGSDRGSAVRALSPFPNAVAFSGHAHQPLTDERNVWQGAFTSIGAASLINSGGRNWRENGAPYARGMSTLARMPYLKTDDCRQGQYMRVYPGRLVIERRDFVWGLPIGHDWTLPVPADGTEHFGSAGVKLKAPRFAPESRIRFTEENGTVKVGFPAATAGGRVYDYEVRAVLLADDYTSVVASKRILAPDYHLPSAKIGRDGEVWFAKAELPPKARIRFGVRPIDCLGTPGDEITAEFQT